MGDVVAERFELMARLGSSTGTVWQARDLLLERDVALKELRVRTADDPAESVRLRQQALEEARAAALIRHVNAVTVQEVLVQQSHPWLVMELVTGRSLRELLWTDGPLAPARAARVGLDVLGALDAAHTAGVLHGGVEPGNVLIRADGSAVLTGFGAAGGAPPFGVTGDVLGSPEFVAPERLRGEGVGPASDLWALGMLLYVCVEGRTPVLGHSIRQTVRAVCEEPMPLASQGGALTKVIGELLARDPGGRPSASRLAGLLGEVVRSETETVVFGRPSARAEPTVGVVRSPVEQAPGRRRRRRLIVVLDAVVGSAVIATATALILLHQGVHIGPASASSRSATGTWIADLAEIPHTTAPDERDQRLADLREQVPGAVLVDSDSWESLPPGTWVVRAPEEFADGFSALAHCRKLGSEECTARYLSHEQDERDLTCEAAPTPDPETCRHPAMRNRSSSRQDG
ncbi:serine/threonine-protein kinase [Streptomyces sp. NRRL WC-3742]|uniref:serine/threonine-protein kinase n=1 Tax=Streptomyces sp. NRRL WC-3742 TaxID=1463934 RepID=UPI000B051C1C|nr:serine/threonine-protein kinase [Streptomyces sp. NRRL WC-3742]